MVDKNKIDIKKLFSALDEELRLKLSSKIDDINHPTTKGDEIELNWMGLLKAYLPERYKIDRGFVVDSKGNISDQIDIIIYDRHFTPFIFRGENTSYIPAEGVYAVFEVKPTYNKSMYDYASRKLKSVRKLERTSVQFTHIMGSNKKELFEIVGGILTKEMGSINHFNGIKEGSDLSIVVCLDHGVKVINNSSIEEHGKNTRLAFFLLKLIERLRALGSVAALDVNEYLESGVKN